MGQISTHQAYLFLGEKSRQDLMTSFMDYIAWKSEELKGSQLAEAMYVKFTKSAVTPRFQTQLSSRTPSPG